MLGGYCQDQRRGHHAKRSFLGVKTSIIFIVMTLIILRYILKSDDHLPSSETDFNFLRSGLSGALLQARHVHRNPPVGSSDDERIENADTINSTDNIDQSNAVHRSAYESARPKSDAKVDRSTDSTNYEAFNVSKILEEEQLEQERTSNKPYSLGPKIEDWDQQRAKWVKVNPGFPNYIRPGKPRVMLVTGSSPKPCENSVGDYMLLKSIKNKVDYCRIHGLEMFYNMALYDAEMSGFWSKLPLIRSLLLSHPEVELLWWMDSDATFTDMAFELPWERYESFNLIMHGWNDMVYEEKDWVGLNTGSILIRNSQWAINLLDRWAPMGPKGKIRNEVGELLSKELKDRPVFEADDQSAMVYILATERDKWGDKVYLEHKYFLHGYWKILVERYEDMMENYHPGLGDKRWPLVTHFVGCKPCQKVGNNPIVSCLKHMERAFNFGDNQILQMYGFTHNSLASRKVKRIREDTSNVVEFQDGIDLLHPSFKAVNI